MLLTINLFRKEAQDKAESRGEFEANDVNYKEYKKKPKYLDPNLNTIPQL